MNNLFLYYWVYIVQPKENIITFFPGPVVFLIKI